MNLKELSQILGLSQTTVSRALNGYPEVNEGTRQRVGEAARRYNYSPNRRAMSLATGRSMTIAHVISSSTQHEMVNPVFGDFVAGAAEIYRENGYDMLITLVTDGDEERAYAELKRKGTADGVIVQVPQNNDRRIEILNETGLPFVVHGRASDSTQSYSWVDVNNRRAFKRATSFLYDLGHRRIALVNGLEDRDFAQRRRRGYEDALAEHGLERDAQLMHSAEMTEVYGYQTMREMLGLDIPPTALVVSSMITAIGARRAIEEKGLVIGKDVSLITHDDELSYLRNGQDVPIFTATRSSVREAGRILADMLLRKIAAPDTPDENVQLEAELVVGQSTGPVR